MEADELLDRIREAREWADGHRARFEEQFGAGEDLGQVLVVGQSAAAFTTVVAVLGSQVRPARRPGPGRCRGADGGGVPLLRVVAVGGRGR
ncbi:hypothetical protein [Yinghuangia seranimata]|uniref:hypothetical protein n=1 Tax=Yinghuangia seranimata TaxID=408067 RepID=UPI00248BB7C3|nr:hypothetical protein [Yinghuangia seranimata]MDI2130522.1 hypothetical protein [Yinghuangia seranimata]